MQILSVDSHVRHMAWASINVSTETVLSTGTVRAPKGLTQQECQDFWHAYARNPAMLGLPILPEWQSAVHLLVEIPDHLKSRSNKQLCDLVALAMCASCLCQGFSNSNRGYSQVRPREWKGRTGKDATKQEVVAICGKKAGRWPEHQIDAAAIGLWWSRQVKHPQTKVA